MRWILLLAMVLTAGCYQVKPHRTWECHKAIRWETEWRGNCVIYEAIVTTAKSLAEMGARPYSVRMNEESLDALAAEKKVVRHRLSSGGALWVVDTTYGAMRVIKDDRLEFMQFIVGRGWDVKRVEEEARPALVSQSEDVEF